MAIVMFLSYIDQIRLNVSGTPGSVILPIATAVNCAAWGSYGFFKEGRDWPIIACNALGFLLSITTVVTAVV